MTQAERRRFRHGLRGRRGEKRDVTHFSFWPDFPFTVEMEDGAGLTQHLFYSG